MSPDAGHPRVTVAVPLYRSERFVDRIVRNVERIDVPNVEIVLSTRHGEEELLRELGRRLGDDPRVDLRCANDRVGWVEHYNALLRESTGTFFLWMPHDDEFPAGYVSGLVDALEANPDAVLAFGALESRNQTRGARFEPPPLDPDEPWTPEVALRLLTTWIIGWAFRGVFRRDRVLEAGLFIRPTWRSIMADVCWAFGLGLIGRFVYVPECRSVKHYDPGSVHAGWRYGIRSNLSVLRAALAFSREHAPGEVGLRRELVRWSRRRIYRLTKRRVARSLPPVWRLLRKVRNPDS